MSTGIITTIAGTGSTGFSGDGTEGTAASISTPFTAAFDSNDNIYILDSFNNRVRLMSKPTSSPTKMPSFVPTTARPTVIPTLTPTYLPR